MITPAHDSGLCPACRGDEEGNDEYKACWSLRAVGYAESVRGETVSDVKLHLGTALT